MPGSVRSAISWAGRFVFTSVLHHGANVFRSTSQSQPFGDFALQRWRILVSAGMLVLVA